MTTYTIDTELSCWPGMDEPGYAVTVTDEDGWDVCGLQMQTTDPETVAAAVAEAGYPDAVPA